MAYYQRLDRWLSVVLERHGYPEPARHPVIHGPDLDTFEARLHAVEEVLAQLATNTARLIRAHEALTVGVADKVASAQVEFQRLHTRLGELVESAEGARLESHGSVVQLHEVTRRLIADVRTTPALTANAVAIAVGSVLAIPAATGDLPMVYVVPDGGEPATGETIRLVDPAAEEDLAA